MARGVLALSGGDAGDDDDAEQDAQPGKILHEARDGEMAALGEIPFGRYYGSHDATPLFVDAGRRVLRAHRPTARSSSAIWPNIQAALRLDRARRRSRRRRLRRIPAAVADRARPAGLEGLGRLGVPSPTGALAEGADRALRDSGLRLRGVARRGRLAAAARAARTTRRVAGRQGRRASDAVRRRVLVSRASATYALALDGEKRPCAVATSNAGHVAPHRHRRATSARKLVARTLMSPESFSGWGIRTVADTEARYNPMSYHNGSIWPHDNALIARGLRAATAFASMRSRCSTGSSTRACPWTCTGCPSCSAAFRGGRREPDAVSGGVQPAGVGVGVRVLCCCRPTLGLEIQRDRARRPLHAGQAADVPRRGPDPATCASLDVDASISSSSVTSDDVGIKVLRRDGDVRDRGDQVAARPRKPS